MPPTVDDLGRKPRSSSWSRGEGHRLTDLPGRQQTVGLPIDVIAAVGTTRTWRPSPSSTASPSQHPATKDMKAQAERQLDLIASENVEPVVLVRYMQIL